jgi:hypothetical protein
MKGKSIIALRVEIKFTNSQLFNTQIKDQLNLTYWIIVAKKQIRIKWKYICIMTILHRNQKMSMSQEQI